MNKVNLNEISVPLFTDFMGAAIARKIPSFIDGLIPSQRRSIVALSDLWVSSNKQTKVQTVAGHTVGNWHPHWDSISGVIIRLGQSHELRYPLVDSKGTNFGGLGIGASAPRYLECSLSKYSEEILLKDTNNITATYVDSYNGKKKEPLTFKPVIPTFFLMNSWSDIAVGIKGSRVSHNIEDLCNSYLAFLENQNCQIKTLVNKLQWPDFPSGGEVINSKEELLEIYSTGKGTFTVRGKYRAEINENKEVEIHIYEFPFGVIPEDFINSVIKLQNEKKLKNITQIFDLSSGEDENGNLKIDVCLVVKNKKVVEETINELIHYKTGFQTKDCRIAHWGLDANFKPYLLGIREIYSLFLTDRLEVLNRKFTYELSVCKDQLHIQEWLQLISTNIDEVIKIIRNSEGKDEARANLIKKFKISEIQANAIGSRNLYSLTKIDSLDIEEKIKKLQEKIKEIKEILKWGEQALIDIMIEEVKEIKKNFKSKRLTTVNTDDVEKREVVVEEKPTIRDRTIYITYSKTGMITSVDGVSVDDKKDILKQLKQLVKFKDKSELVWYIKTSNLTTTLLFTSKWWVFGDIGVNLSGKDLVAHSLFKKFGKSEQEQFISGTTFTKESEDWLLVNNNWKWFIFEGLNQFKDLKLNKQASFFNIWEQEQLFGMFKINKQKELLWVAFLTTENKFHYIEPSKFIRRNAKSMWWQIIFLLPDEKIVDVKLIYSDETEVKIGKTKVDFSKETFTRYSWKGKKLK